MNVSFIGPSVAIDAVFLNSGPHETHPSRVDFGSNAAVIPCVAGGLLDNRALSLEVVVGVGEHDEGGGSLWIAGDHVEGLEADAVHQVTGEVVGIASDR